MEMIARAWLTWIPPFAMTGLVGCGGGGGGSGPPHSVGGAVSGLVGSGLVLVDNGTDSLKILASGTFTFAMSVAGGAAFDVMVQTQPANPSQTCTVAHGSGTIAGSDVTNVAVTCTTNTYSVGGTISGLEGSGLILALNGTENPAVSKGGAFTLTPAVASGSAYTVSVATQPTSPPQTCTVANSSGNVISSNVTNVAVSCTTNTYIVGAYVAGLAGSGLSLSYNGVAGQTVSRNGYSSLATGVAIGTNYAVTITSQPTNPAQTCTLSNGSGSVGTANVTSILVYCPQAVGVWTYVATAGSIPLNNPGELSVPGTLSAYSIDAGSGALSLVAGSTVSTGPNVAALQPVPHTSFLWAFSVGGGDQVDNMDAVSSVYVYTANANSGLLTANAGNPFYTLDGPAPQSGACYFGGELGLTENITLAPSGTYGYASNTADMGAENAGSWVFTVSASGAPSALTALAYGGCGLQGSGDPVSVDPSGQFAYYPILPSNLAPYDVVAATINSTTGVLTTVPGTSPLPIGRGYQAAAAFDPFGRFVYFLDGKLIYGFAIDPASGALTAISGSPISFPSASDAMQFSPDGQFAYVTASQGLYVYTIDPVTGALAATGAAVPLQITTYPNATVTQIDPSGQFLYTSALGGSGQTGIYAYTRNPATGALTIVSGSPFAVTPQQVALSIGVIN